MSRLTVTQLLADADEHLVRAAEQLETARQQAVAVHAGSTAAQIVAVQDSIRAAREQMDTVPVGKVIRLHA